MPKKISVDEIISLRKDIKSDVAPVMKAAKAPVTWNEDSRTARFVMNAQETDRYGDVVITSGIDTEEFEKNPVALLFHNSRTWPVGTWGNIAKVTRGKPPRLEGDVTILPAGGPVAEVDETAWMIANGGIRACSIGFMPDWEEAEMITDDEGRWTGGIKWHASSLLEASIVAVPASPSSLIKDAGGNMRLAREFIEDVLDNYAKTPDGLLLPREQYEKAYRHTVEKIKEDKAMPKITPKSDEATAAPIIEDKNAPVADVTEPLIPNVTLDAFAALVGENDTVALRDADELTLVIERDGESVEELVLPVEMTIAQIKEVQASILERVNKSAADTAVISIDTAEAEAKLADLETRADSLIAKFARLFGGKTSEPAQEPEQRALPTAEEMEAAKAKAVAIRERLTEKGLIAA